MAFESARFIVLRSFCDLIVRLLDGGVIPETLQPFLTFMIVFLREKTSVENFTLVFRKIHFIKL